MPAPGSLGAKAAAAARRRRRGGQAHNFGRRIALVAAAAIGAALWIKISPLRRLPAARIFPPSESSGGLMSEADEL